MQRSSVTHITPPRVDTDTWRWQTPMPQISPIGTWLAMAHTQVGWREPLAKSQTRAAPIFILDPWNNRYTPTPTVTHDDSRGVPSTRDEASRESLLWRHCPRSAPALGNVCRSERSIRDGSSEVLSTPDDASFQMAWARRFYVQCLGTPQGIVGGAPPSATVRLKCLALKTNRRARPIGRRAIGALM